MWVLYGIIICIWIIIYSFAINYVKNLHKLFNWYCDNYYNFKNKLSNLEIEFINKYFEYGKYELIKNMLFGKNRLSFYSYSLKVTEGVYKYDRFNIGSTIFPIYNDIKDILYDKNIKLHKKYHNNIHGIGWDGDIFKIYIKFDDINNIPFYDRFLADNYKWNNNYHKWGLLSFSYKKNKLFEKKLYLYHIKNNITEMISNKRGTIIQIDDNLDIINESVINDMKTQFNYNIDTYVWKNKDNYCIYFS